MLRSAFINLASDSDTFSQKLYISSDRLKKAAELDEIRELKRVIATEVRELQRVVIEKQEKDDRVYATLSKKVGELQSKLEIARQEAASDHLTRVANRGAFERALQGAIEQKKKFVLAILDIDHFKTVNDTHGHRVGDKVILCAAHWLSGAMRTTDMVARFGGDEFAVLLMDIGLKPCEEKFVKLLGDISGRRYVYSVNGKENNVVLTLSCGLSEYANGDNAEDLIQRADEALYNAKKKRNHVCTSKRPLLGSFFKE
jgi:diguanylate cyclase